MSLFGTIQQSAGALQAAQVGIQVVGNNIANANTPGFLRQELRQASSEASRIGGLIQGFGVRPLGVVQVVDNQLAERLFNAGSALAGAETLDNAFSQLEELTNDLNGGGLNSQLTAFNNSLNELSTTPGDPALREFVILQATTLANSITQNRASVVDRLADFNGDLDLIATDINRLTSQIAELNIEIATIEGGGLINSDATGLRDQRLLSLEELATFADLNIQEQPSGVVNVFVGGDFLINNGIARQVESAFNGTTGANEARIIETDSPLQVTTGRLAATIQARDGVFGDYLESLDGVAENLIRTVNEVHTQGQGSRGLQEVISEVASTTGVPLVEAGLSFVPNNGSFDITVIDDNQEVIRTERINVQRLGEIDDSTVQSIVADIDAIDGVAARVTSSGQVEITSESFASSFYFSEDTSGFLSAAGINTFFVGNDASNISVNPTLLENGDFLSVSRNGIGQDTEILTELVDLIERPTDGLNGRSIRSTYEQTVAELGQQISLQNSATEGIRVFHETLETQHLAITGVNIDEESIKLISFQRAFQASSRVISTTSDLLELLTTL